jgi:1,4-dihydroxy-2-naphthoyl-CoA hydrolase
MTQADLIASMPFVERLGMELTATGRDEVQGRLAWDPSLCTAGGIMHGGALMAFADTLGAVCAFYNLPPQATTATIESKTNLFRAVRGGTVSAVSRPLHVGRMVIVVQTDLTDDQGRRVAQVTQTQAVIPNH